MANIFSSLNLKQSELYTYVQKSSDFTNGSVDPTALLGDMLVNLLTPTGRVIAGTKEDAFKSATEYCKKYDVINTSFNEAYLYNNE